MDDDGVAATAGLGQGRNSRGLERGSDSEQKTQKEARLTAPKATQKHKTTKTAHNLSFNPNLSKSMLTNSNFAKNNRKQYGNQQVHFR